MPLTVEGVRPVSLVFLLLVTLVYAQEYTVPQPTIEALYPKGLRISIPDSDGVQLFAFHGNVNRPLYQLEAGEMSVDVTRKTNGRWTYLNSQKRLKPGDIIYYWLYVQRDGLGYRLDDQTFQVVELIEPQSGLAVLDTASGSSSTSSHSGNGNVNRPSYTTNRPPPYRPPTNGHRPPPDEYRPPPDEYRPPPDEYRPPPDEYRPPTEEYRPPPDEYRPPSSNEYRPPSSNNVYRPPTNDNRHTTTEGSHLPSNNYNRPPPDEYIPQPDEYRPTRPTPSRPKPDEYRPSGTGDTTQNRPTSNEYRPPPPYGPYPPPPRPSTGDLYQPSTNPEISSPVHHNHHVGFAGGNGAVDRYPNRPVYSPYEPSKPNPSQPTYSEGTTPNALTSDRFSVPPKQTERECELSATTVNGKHACKGQVVFDEKWTTLDLRRWEHEVKISGHPDFEFCVYAQHPENSWVNSGQLHLKPTLTNDKYGADFIRKGKLQLDDCTAGPPNSDSCWREAMFSYILPPTLAARLNSKRSFSFKYGIIEVRAKLPQGDWIYPELWLQSRNEEYGPGLSSGRIVLAMARGNSNLRGDAGSGLQEDLSAKRLVVGVLAGGKGVGSANAKKKFFHKNSDYGKWADQFHNYTLLWTPETLAFSVDGVEIGVARPELSGSGGLIRGPEGEEADPWARGSRLAPFDKEFFISLGVAVGGVHAFPDGCRSNGIEKPWKNTGAKAMLNFWNAKNHWHPTWNDKSQLLIDSVRVTALNN